jgi:predicted phosphodiesterase
MRVAVMSDIHGYNLALATVLADIEARGPFDEIVVAGDLVEGGPGPAEVLHMLKDGVYTVLRGNTDRDVVVAAAEDWDQGGMRYVIDQIGDDGVEFLASLPFSRRITPPGGVPPDDDLLVVHANPYDLERPLAPNLSEREVRELLGGTQAAAIAFGHIHIAYTRRIEGTLLIDVSAVGNPKDRDLRCKYGIIEWDEASKSWTAELRRLPYPLEETILQILASGLPKPEKARRKLEKASY